MLVLAPPLARAANYDVLPLGVTITGPEQLTFGAWFFEYEKGRAFSCAVTRTPAELTGICHEQTPDRGSLLTGPNVKSAVPQRSPSLETGIGGVWQVDRMRALSSSATFPIENASRSHPSKPARRSARPACSWETAPIGAVSDGRPRAPRSFGHMAARAAAGAADAGERPQDDREVKAKISLTRRAQVYWST
jgi:hypothetical protein